MISIFRAYQGLDLLIYGGAFVLALLLAFAIHEWAHAYVAHKEGDPTAKAVGRLSINPLVHIDLLGFAMLLLFGFGWAKPVPVNSSNLRNGRKSELKVSLAGVVVNLIMTIVFGFLYVLTLLFVTSESVAILKFLSALMMYLSVTPFVLAIFNLIPIYPLDGYNALRTLAKNPYNKFFTFMQQYGMWIMLILLVTGAFSYLIDLMFRFVLTPLFNLYGLILGVV